MYAHFYRPSTRKSVLWNNDFKMFWFSIIHLPFSFCHRSVISNIKCFIETNDKERMTLSQCLILGTFPMALPWSFYEFFCEGSVKVFNSFLIGSFNLLLIHCRSLSTLDKKIFFPKCIIMFPICKTYIFILVIFAEFSFYASLWSLILLS